MHIGLVGGIFNHPPAYRETLQPTTETMLAQQLRARGHLVTEISPRDVASLLTLRKQGIDVLHVHHPGRLTSLLGIGPHPVPVIYTPHRTNNPPKKLLSVGHQLLLKRARKLVGLSPTETKTLTTTHNLNERRISLIPNGFDPSIFAPKQRSTPSGGETWKLLFVGQLIAPKQPLAILEAIDCPELRERVQVRFVFHRSPLLDQLQGEIDKRGLQSSVDLVGRLSGEELATEYRGANFLLLPSNTLEALPSVITEGVFTGLPVIAGDVGGIRWQLDGFGSCIPDIDAMRLRDALIQSMDRYDDLSAEGIVKAQEFRERFSVDTMVDRHLDMYSDIVTEYN